MPTIVIATSERAVLRRRFAESESATLYTGIPGLDEDDVRPEGAVILEEPPLHIEFDQVRQLWAVRKATAEEVEAREETLEERAEARRRLEAAEARERAEAAAAAEERAESAAERNEAEERELRPRRTR
jgi:hypothetical protein